MTSAYLLDCGYNHQCSFAATVILTSSAQYTHNMELAYSTDVSGTQLNLCATNVALLAYYEVFNEVKWENIFSAVT